MRLGNNPLLFTEGWNAPWCLGFVAMFDHLLDSLKVGEKSSRKKLKSMEMLETFGDLPFYDCYLLPFLVLEKRRVLLIIDVEEVMWSSECCISVGDPGSSPLTSGEFE